ncbi:MAG TPA: translation initiation factor IF-2 [Blastocatellia bacterium]|nr:translation initiation factor IF-2 [Blastocatellia bacterium]
MGKVRIYELARELKQESKKVLEDARRLGVDVSVPSNTLDEAIAEKIRELYYPKKEPVTQHRSARLIKHAAKPAMEQEGQPQPTSEAKVATPQSAPSAPAAPPATTQATEAPKPRVVKLAPPSAPPTLPQPSEVVSAPPVEEARSVPAETAPPAVSEEVISSPTPEPEESSVPSAPPAPVIAPDSEGQQSLRTNIQPVPTEAAPSVRTFTLKPIAPPPPAKVPEPVTEAPSAPPATTPPAAEKSAGTNVYRIPVRTPMPMPQPQQPVRREREQPPQRRDARTDRQDRPGATERPATPGRQPFQRSAPSPQGEAGQGQSPQGAPYLKEYIPPKDNRRQGRHSARPRGPVEKQQEGNQKFSARRPVAGPAVAQRVVPAELKPVRLVEGTTVREFAEKLDIKPKDVVTALFERGVMATINQTLNADVAREIGKQFGYEVSYVDFEEMIVESEFEITPEAMDDTEQRAPVVTVMGHVDHGKTSLLDVIRESRVAEGEAGGITQHIGAYSVSVPDPDDRSKMRRIVFLDTPGHEAFTMMRARGAKVTDIVILVVAADDGVMPQTVEAIEHARAANVPIVVAINKIDKPDANPERVKKELADRGLLWDGWGGDTTMVEVSAKKKLNIDSLLEMLILTADLLDLKSNSKRMATGTVLEAKLDRGRGAVATVLIQNGTLKVGEPFIVGNFFGRVRALFDDRRRQQEEVGPATPVEVLGLQGVPSAGDQFQVVGDETKARQISEFRLSKARASALARSAARGLDQLHAQMIAGELKELLVILKADVQGSVEVLKETLTKLSTDRVKVRIIRSGVGAITYDDVLLASASNATATGAATVIIGFNVRPETRADDAAKQESVDIRLHSIIYKVEEEIRAAMIGMLDATEKETVLGKAEVRDVIRVPRIGAVAGCMVTNGSIKRTAKARLIRDNVVIFENSIGSLRRFKDDVSEVQQGYECGITIERFNDYKVGDVIEAYIIEKVAATSL